MQISTIVKTKKGYVWIDTTKLESPLVNYLDAMGLGNPDAVAGGYETMVFASDKKGKVKDWKDWKDLDKANYLTEKEARKGHKEMVKLWESKLKN